VRFKPEVILAAPATDVMLSIALEGACRLPGAKLFVHTAIHISDTQEENFENLARQLRRMDMVFTNTEYEKKFLTAHGLDPAQVEVKGPGVDVGRFLSLSAGAADKGMMDRVLDKTYVLYFGRKQKGKGLESLVEAVELLRRDYPGLYVVLGGEETEHSKKLALVQWKSKPFILSMDPVEDATKRALMEKALAFSMVSHVDSFGIVYCESWLSRRPVIGADNGQMRCVIRDGEDGFLVPYGDAPALAGKIRFFLENPGAADRMGESGYRKVMEGFGEHAMERKTYDFITRLVGPH
jgi:D-inositol-3-phosphate glycosyltransferase